MKVSEDLIDRVVPELERCASADSRRYLPTSDGIARGLAGVASLRLTEKQQRMWASGIREIVRAQFSDETALGLRMNLIVLKRSPSLPSRDMFFGCYLASTRGLIEEVGTIGRDQHELIVGISAAEASSWSLRTIQSQLEEFDLILNPKESYLSLRSAPKQLGVWREIALRLMRALPPSASRFAASKAIASAMLTYAGSPLFVASSAAQFAKDTVLKWLATEGSLGEPV